MRIELFIIDYKFNKLVNKEVLWMPKQIADTERNRIKDLLCGKGIELIKAKGFKKVAVEDIFKACGIGKGSFYL